MESNLGGGARSCCCDRPRSRTRPIENRVAESGEAGVGYELASDSRIQTRSPGIARIGLFERGTPAGAVATAKLGRPCLVAARRGGSDGAGRRFGDAGGEELCHAGI